MHRQLAQLRNPYLPASYFLSAVSLLAASKYSCVVTFTGCPIEVVKETAELVRNIIDAEKIEEVTIDARERANRIANQANRQDLQIVGAQ